LLSIVVRNAAEATIYGAEFEANYMPIDGLTLAGTLGLLHAKYTSFPNAGAANACDCFDGNDVALAPDWETSLSAQYERPIDSWADHTMFARVEWNHQAKSYTEPSDSIRYDSPAYSLLNARIGIEGDQWGLYAWGKNLTNTFHSVGGSYLLVTYAKNVNIPRTFGLELSLKN
jgi:outer membrane receptor protein involved in Fe transport